MNKELLNKVADHIENHPEEFDMEDWDCGTTACIAGHILRMTGAKVHPAAIPVEAARLVGLDYSEDTVSRLFHVGQWPYIECEEYCEASRGDNREECANIAAARIRHFISTNGAE